MKKLSFSPTFFKDILFNEFTHYKYLLINKVLLFGGVCLNGIFFLLSLFIGGDFVNEVNECLKMLNVLLVVGILTIMHRFKVNVLNISRDISNLDSELFLALSVENVEVLPKNFILYDDMPLYLLKKIYKEGAYIIIKTRTSTFTFYLENEDAYLLDEDDEKMNEVKTLKLSREII